MERGGFMDGRRSGRLLYVLKGGGRGRAAIQRAGGVCGIARRKRNAFRFPGFEVNPARQAAVLRADGLGPSRRFPTMLSPDPGQREKAMQAILEVISASGKLGVRCRATTRHVRGLFLPDAIGSARTAAARGDKGQVNAMKPDSSVAPREKYQRLIDGSRRERGGITTAVVHPCDQTSLEGAVEARAPRSDRADSGRPETRIRDVAAKAFRSTSPVSKSSTPTTVMIRRRKAWNWFARARPRR